MPLLWVNCKSCDLCSVVKGNVMSRRIVYQFCLSEIKEKAELKRCALRQTAAVPSQFEPDISENIISVAEPASARTNIDLFLDYVRGIEASTHAAAKSFIKTWISQYTPGASDNFVPAFKLGQQCVFYDEDPGTKRLTCSGLKYGAAGPTMTRPPATHRMFLFPRSFPFKVKIGTDAAAIDADPGVDIGLPALHNLTQTDIFKLLPPLAARLERSTRIGKFVSATISYPNLTPAFSMTATARFSSDPEDSSFEWQFGEKDSLVKKDPPDFDGMSVRDYSNSIAGAALPILRVTVAESCNDPTVPKASEQSKEGEKNKVVLAIVVIVVAVLVFVGILVIGKLNRR